MNKKTGLIVVVIVVVVLVIIAVFAFENHGAAQQSQSAQTETNAATGSPPTTPAAGAFTSSADGFSASFMAAPQAEKTTFNSPTAGTIPLTKYIATAGSGTSTQYYAIDVYHYPKNYQFPTGYLTGAMQLFATAVNAKYPGAKLVSETPTDVLGNNALSGVFNLTINGIPENGYVVILTKNQNTYGIGTYGTDQNAFNVFLSSFTFAQ